MSSLLILTVFLPLAGSLALFLSPRLDQNTARWLALGTALFTLGFSLILVLGFETGVTTPQFAFSEGAAPYGLTWIERPDIRFSLGLDGLSLWLFALTSVLMIAPSGRTTSRPSVWLVVTP